MSEAKWSVVRKASTGKITANSVIQIVLPEIPSRYKKMLYYFHQTPLSSLTVEGGLGLCTLVSTLQHFPLAQQGLTQPDSCGHILLCYCSRLLPLSQAPRNTVLQHCPRKLRSAYLLCNGLHHTASIEAEECMIHVYLQFCIWIHVGKTKTDSGAV